MNSGKYFLYSLCANAVQDGRFVLGIGKQIGCETSADSFPYPIRFIRPRTLLRHGYHWRSVRIKSGTTF